ncbi:MAG: RapZ C-terminal domain-containing protein, partial [Alphaproteobacteria bacterium]
DLVFDVRFLSNPHYIEDLRPMSGLDAEVGAYVEADPGTGTLLESLEQLFSFVLPRYEQEGKSYLTIAVGCTGGRHRSVFIAEKLASMLYGQGWPVRTTHRDIDREHRIQANR